MNKLYLNIITGLSTIYIINIATDKYIRKNFFDKGKFGFYFLIFVIIINGLLDSLLKPYLEKYLEPYIVKYLKPYIVKYFGKHYEDYEDKLLVNQ